MAQVLEMKRALVIHPRMSVYGGGELVCLHTIRALQDIDYEVSLFCDSIDVQRIELQFGMGEVVKRSRHIPLFAGDIEAFSGDSTSPRFATLNTLRRLNYAKKTIQRLQERIPDVVFQTQPSVHFLPGSRSFEFIYQPNDIDGSDFYHMGYRLPDENWKHTYFAIIRRYRDLIIERPPRRQLLALSRNLVDHLRARGYDSSLVFPPCRQFKTLTKMKQVVTVARIDPVKRLEVFCDVARNLPECRFVIVGTESTFHPGYKASLLSKAPPNVKYVESPISLRPELLGESKVYLHTSKQRGLAIALAEGLSAGCMPVCYSGGDGVEVIRESGIGFIFESTEQATEEVKEALNMSSPTPEEISARSYIFSPQIFEQKIQSLVER